jgi:hypothetical protein
MYILHHHASFNELPPIRQNQLQCEDCSNPLKHLPPVVPEATVKKRAKMLAGRRPYPEPVSINDITNTSDATMNTNNSSCSSAKINSSNDGTSPKSLTGVSSDVSNDFNAAAAKVRCV